VLYLATIYNVITSILYNTEMHRRTSDTVLLKPPVQQLLQYNRFNRTGWPQRAINNALLPTTVRH